MEVKNNYNRPTYLVEETVGEHMPFKSLRAAAHYLWDSDMSEKKPQEICIYQSLIYALRRGGGRYKNYYVYQI